MLQFPLLDPASLRISVYANFSGSTLSPLLKREVGFLILLTDSSSRFSLLHWPFNRPRRVCRGSTAADLLALADAVAAALDVRTPIREVLSQGVPLDGYTDSAPAYHIIASFKDPADMTGKNDLYMLRRALLDGGVSHINHVHGSDNPGDAWSKPTFSRPPPNPSLSRALVSGSLSTPVVTHTTTEGYRTSPRPGLNMPRNAPAPRPSRRTPPPRRHPGKCTRVTINIDHPAPPRRPPRHRSTHAKAGCALGRTPHPPRRPSREAST